ncbi:manganese efflux pump MntP family protein [Pseudonocardia alaniniphila]|uniref:Manganese efflux pump MntP family protein n=1 Tax=Pseudonocardia alaniniphila TaxID=75291 RepID=A0ABS9TSN9_9PSEU|nr:manganese efflux pump [Pseudonocardia alaniniphila]MCH6171554.1 manganese efflux pump MntP family protein [Pseudonocardia alaniniphila]
MAEIRSHMIVELLVLGFFLSLDNFRVAIALGTVPFSVRRSLQVALVFGLWDGVMPLVGLMLGNYVSQSTGTVAEYVGSAALGAYGLYLLIGALRKPEPEEIDHPWALFGIPLSLSLDNLLAGAGLGLLGFAPWISATVFGLTTAVMSLVGLHVGRVAARLIRIRSDLLSGVALIVAAVVLPIAFGN